MSKRRNERVSNGWRRRQLRARVLAAYNVCAICGKPVDKTLKTPHPMSAEVDELVPVSRGGDPYSFTNCRLTHRRCNRFKSDKTDEHARALLAGRQEVKASSMQTSETGETTKGRKAREAPMKCELCGKEFQPSGHGRPQKYCSKSCRQKADYRRKKNRPARDRNGKPPVKAVETKQKPEQDLDQRSFERMMDGSMLDILRDNRDLLLKAMADPTTPANALPAASSSTYANASKRSKAAV